MRLIKMGGKYDTGEVSDSYIAKVPTSGMMELDGTVVSSSSYSYTQKISVHEDDEINAVLSSNHNSIRNIRVVTAFSGNTAIPSKGWKPDAASSETYIVPEGIDGIVISSGSGEATSVDIKIVTENAQVRGIRVNRDGFLFEKHIWENELITVCSQYEIADTTGHPVPDTPIDISEFAIASIRIVSTLDQPLEIRFYDDINQTRWLEDSNGDAFLFIKPVDSTMMVITPEDCPILNYLRRLKLRLSCAEAPATGIVSITLMLKR